MTFTHWDTGFLLSQKSCSGLRLHTVFTGHYSLCKCSPNSPWFNQCNFLFLNGLAFPFVGQEHQLQWEQGGLTGVIANLPPPCCFWWLFPAPLPAAPPLKIHFNSVKLARSPVSSYDHLIVPVNRLLLNSVSLTSCLLSLQWQTATFNSDWWKIYTITKHPLASFCHPQDLTETWPPKIVTELLLTDSKER